MSSIRTKLTVFIVVPTLLIYILILGGALAFLRARALHELERSTTRLASHYAAGFDGYFREAAAVADTSALAFARFDGADERQVFDQLRGSVGERLFIFGACAAFEPGTVRPKDELFAPYVHRAGDGLAEMIISRDVYDWYADPAWTWFQEPKRLSKSVWSAPYFDEGAGNALMTTYSAPFFSQGAFRGVATVDINLVQLRETIGKSVIDGVEFIIAAGDGTIVYDRRPERILITKLADLARASDNAELERALPGILGGKAGVVDVPGWDDPERKWLFHAPITSTGWTFIAIRPEREALAGIHRRMVIAASALAGTLVIIIGCIAFVSARMARPLSSLTDQVGEIAGGNLDARVTNVTSRDELGRLANAFNAMAGRLREHVERLAEERASRERVERDLSIARDIQQGLLPDKAPALKGYDVSGWSRPADETGGDYYDWQPLPDGSIAISLADVTGHGIGPALVTAVCRAYARASFPQEVDIGKVLNRINVLLCEDLQAERFVTFVVAVVNPLLHVIRLLSAGHGPLFYYSAAEDNVLQFNAHHMPMGLMSDIMHGPPSEFRVAVGDALVLVTDGFLEWPNDSGEQFGEERLAETIRASHGLSSACMIERMVADVERFAGGSKQLDDLTAVVLKRCSP